MKSTWKVSFLQSTMCDWKLKKLSKYTHRLTVRQRWELSSHQNLISFWSQHRVRTESEALISQKFDFISFHKKFFSLILQECDFILIQSHLISWKSDFISQKDDLILILSHLISWKTDFISWRCNLILISFHLISQKYDFISVLTWNQNEMRYFNPGLVI